MDKKIIWQGKMKAYKVFLIGRRGWRCGPVLMSVCARGEATVYYARGKWSEAPAWLAEKGYGLCCFETEEKAKQFFNSIPYNYKELWEVDAEGIIKDLPLAMDLIALERKELREHLRGGWAEGTIMAKKVKLVRQIL
jgi:hypothetical protein